MPELALDEWSWPRHEVVRFDVEGQNQLWRSKLGVNHRWHCKWYLVHVAHFRDAPLFLFLRWRHHELAVSSACEERPLKAVLFARADELGRRIVANTSHQVRGVAEQTLILSDKPA